MTTEPDSRPQDSSLPQSNEPQESTSEAASGETPSHGVSMPPVDVTSEGGSHPQADVASQAGDECHGLASSESGESQGDSPKRTIRIGSQRFSEDLHRPKPQPIVPPKPAAETAEEKPAVTGEAGEKPEDEEHGDRRGGRRGKGKFDRKERPRPTEIAKVERTTPLPSTRAPLSGDLEEELQAALGDMSLDDIVAAEAAAAATAAARIPQGESTDEGKQTGTIVSMHNDDVFVELGARRQGVLSLHQFKEPPQIGDTVQVKVVGGENEDGLLQLTLPGAAMEVSGDWLSLTTGSVVMAHVTGHNKGGLECQVSNIRGFIPASQASLYRVEDLSTLVGEKFACVITECNPERKNLVLSRRQVLEREQEEAKAAAFSSLEPGQVKEGVVRKIMDFGAFVDLGGGVDGLLHVSRLSWGRVKHPSEVLKEGDTVRVQIEKIDPETERISLSMRDLVENPWDRAADKYPVGTVVKGTVTRTMDFGAFVELEPGVEGLVHISELASHRVTRVNLFVKTGQEVEAKVVSVDKDNKRIGLSMKALQAVPVEASKEEEPEEEVAKPVSSVKKRNQPLKGGTGRGSGGESFGLKW